MAFFLTLLPNFCLAGNYSYTYQLLNHPNGSTRYQLAVSITSSLYNYYQGQDHLTYSYNDLAKFVTPDCLSPIASNLRSVYYDNEDFANGVLMFVHQIPYEASTPQEYPVETMVQNKGDCDLFSFTAASIMKAGGLDIVLLYYERESHMNVGVNLPTEPRDARTSISYFSYNGRRYYMAECTGGNWEWGWRVGECPDNVKGVTARIITLEKCEQSSPEHVTSNLNTSSSLSTLSLALSSSTTVPDRSISIGGSILPMHPNVHVTIYVCLNSGSWNVLSTIKTDSNGEYSYLWTPKLSGTFSFRANWSGDMDHAGADSSVHTLTVIPLADMMIIEVQDASGKALVNATVIINCANGTFYTDESGRIYLHQTPYGNYSVKVYWKGVNVGTETVNVTSGKTHTISCSVYNLTITVKNVLGIAALGGEVRVYGENDARDVFLRRITGIDGTLRLIQLPKGSYQIDVLCAGSANSKTIFLNNSTSAAFLGIWDYTGYMVITAIGAVIAVMAFLLSQKKEVNRKWSMPQRP